MISRLLVLCASFGAMAAVRPVRGQAPVTQRAPQQAELCFRPKPRANCRAYLFFDATGGAVLYRTSHLLGTAGLEANDLGLFGAGSIGFMSNIDARHAVGIGLEVGASDGGHGRASAKAHWRQWSASGEALDVSAGPLVGDITKLDAPSCPTCQVRARAYGVTADAAVFERHGLGAFTGVDLLHGDGRTSAGIHAGVRLEAYPALAAAVVVSAGFLALFAALSSMHD